MILNRQRKVRINRRALELFLKRVRGELRLGACEITICFVSDAEMSRMNKTFRRKNGTTDVLSFPAAQLRRPIGIGSGRRARTGSRELGDVAISPVIALRNAKQHDRKLADELRTLILHGVLHLLGYDHEADQGQMNRLERKLRGRLKLENAGERLRPGRQVHRGEQG